MAFVQLSENSQRACDDLYKEEIIILELLNDIAQNRGIDTNPRWIAIAKTGIQQAFMAARKGVAHPKEV